MGFLKYLALAKKAYKFYQKHQAKKAAAAGGAPGASASRDAGPMGMVDQVMAMAGGAGGNNKWKLSNIGAIGSKEDAALRKQAAEGEPEFAGAGANVGIEVWRIEKFKRSSGTLVYAVKQSVRASNLSLYSGDAYIVLVTTQKPDSSELEWALHFWLGSDSTQDESGSAAYFTVNIDDMLNGKPVQYRETQGEETKLFRSHFESITYLSGGCDSGFKTVEPTSYKPRLLLVKGKMGKVQVSQIPLESAAVNNGDVFILDNGLTLYQFNGSTANVSEKRRAMEIVEQDIQAERNGQPQLTILDGDEALGCAEFWGLLEGGAPSAISDGSDQPDEVPAHAEVDFGDSKKLFKISDESGELTLTLEKEGSSLSKSDINDNDAWCISCTGQLFVFVGSGTSKDERFYVTQHVGKVLEAAQLSKSAPTTFFNCNSSLAVWDKFF